MRIAKAVPDCVLLTAESALNPATFSSDVESCGVTRSATQRLEAIDEAQCESGVCDFAAEHRWFSAVGMHRGSRARGPCLS